MDKIVVALCGAGRMGQIHLANLLKHQQVTVKYVYDPAISSLECLAKTSTKLVHTIDEILTDQTVLACIIATPSVYHADLITACARANKHVFVEKPVSFHLDVLTEVQKTIASCGIMVQIGFNRRFDPSMQALRAQLRQRDYGRFHCIKITNRDPWRPRLDFVKDSGGLFFDFNIHDFAMLRSITGEEVVEVFAVGDALVDERLKEYHDIDTAIISARLSSGAIAIIDCSRETGYGYDQQLEVLLEKGMLRVANQNITEVAIRSSNGLIGDAIYESFVERYQDSYRFELDHFFASLNHKQASPNINDAISAVKIAQAAQKSFNERRSIALAE